MDTKDCFVVKLTGNVRLIIPSGPPKECGTAKLYVEFDDLIYPDGSSYRENYNNTKDGSLIISPQEKFAADKPLQIPVYMEELVRVIQE